MPERLPLVITRTLQVPADEIELRNIHASGPGGQHVNKVATAAQLRFDVAGSPSLPGLVKTRLREIAGRRMSQDGVLIITARRFRSPAQNREDALKRLSALIARAAHTPRKRIPTRPPRAARARRRAAKDRHSKLKASRRKPGPGD